MDGRGRDLKRFGYRGRAQMARLDKVEGLKALKRASRLGLARMALKLFGAQVGL